MLVVANATPELDPCFGSPLPHPTVLDCISSAYRLFPVVSTCTVLYCSCTGADMLDTKSQMV